MQTHRIDSNTEYVCFADCTEALLFASPLLLHAQVFQHFDSFGSGLRFKLLFFLPLLVFKVFAILEQIFGGGRHHEANSVLLNLKLVLLVIQRLAIAIDGQIIRTFNLRHTTSQPCYCCILPIPFVDEQAPNRSRSKIRGPSTCIRCGVKSHQSAQRAVQPNVQKAMLCALHLPKSQPCVNKM